MSRGTTPNSELYVGIMSGTSLDAIDTVLVDFSNDSASIIASREHAFPAGLLNRLNQLVADQDPISLDHFGQLHRELGIVYAEATLALLAESNTAAADVAAIGCHGQTVRHRTDLNPPFTLQIGDGATIACMTGIQCVNDFRSADIALGGQGAPLAPAFHEWAFSSATTARAIVNVGGIANLTALLPAQAVIGFDTGPGNTLMDQWCNEYRGKPFDRDGKWAASGVVDETLLATLLTDPYFAAAVPKSTGREYFSWAWLDRYLGGNKPPDSAVDTQATLAELTARSIADAAMQYAPDAELYICGGGAFNTFLLERIAAHLPVTTVASTAKLGVPPEWVEAVAFAWLARARLSGATGNIPTVTGASRAALLGAIHNPIS